jgi:UDP-glucuronate decarboxylase
VDDLIRGLIALMETPADFSGPVNLGNPRPTSMSELAQRIRAMTVSRSELVYRPLPSDDPLQRCPDISQAQRILGWQPETPLETGLARTIDYFRAARAGLGTASLAGGGGVQHAATSDAH